MKILERCATVSSIGLRQARMKSNSSGRRGAAQRFPRALHTWYFQVIQNKATKYAVARDSRCDS